MKSGNSFSKFAFATTFALAAGDATAGIITECAFSYDVQIEQSAVESVEDKLVGVASIDLPAFIQLFEPPDRLAAARLFTDCLSRHYESSEGGSVVNLEAKVSLLPDIIPTLAKNVDFALRLGEAIRFQDGSSMAISRTRFEGWTPVANLVVGNTTYSPQFDIGDQARTSATCFVRYLSRRELPEGGFAYTFDYRCE